MAEEFELEMAIEGCRPGSGDLGAPEMVKLRAAIASDIRVAERFHAIGRFDAKLADAICQGDVSSGLEDRILAALSEPGMETSSADDALRERPSRRRVTIALATAATAAAIAAGVTFWRMIVDDERHALADIHEQAATWSDALNQSHWQASVRPRGYPFASEVLLDPTSWQRVSLPGKAGNAVAYRYPPPSGVGRMTLFVLKAKVGGMPFIPPRSPYKTQDWLVAAWQVGENVFVLVLQDGELGDLQDAYQQNVRTIFKSA